MRKDDNLPQARQTVLARTEDYKEMSLSMPAQNPKHAISVHVISTEKLISDCLAFCLNDTKRFMASSVNIPIRAQLVQDHPNQSRITFPKGDIFILRGKIHRGSCLLQIASEIMRLQKSAKIILIAEEITSALVEFALEFGAHGVVDETINVARLANIVEFVFHGEIYVPAEYVVEQVRNSIGTIYTR